MKRRSFLLSGLAASLSCGAGQQVWARTSAFCVTAGGLALEGYDTVSYFSGAGPQRGRRDLAVLWKGAVWYFASPLHRELFEANPWPVVPRYGGYCALAMSQGRLMQGDPLAWHLVQGRLFLTANQSARTAFSADLDGYISKADAHWPDALFG